MDDTASDYWNNILVGDRNVDDSQQFFGMFVAFLV